MAGQDVPRLYCSETDRDGDFDGAVPDPKVVAEAWEACAIGSFGFASQAAHDVDFSPQRQAVPHLASDLLGGRAVELGLADVLDGLIGRADPGQRAPRCDDCPPSHHWC
jgi:hypothetical protein